MKEFDAKLTKNPAEAKLVGEIDFGMPTAPDMLKRKYYQLNATSKKVLMQLIVDLFKNGYFLFEHSTDEVANLIYQYLVKYMPNEVNTLEEARAVNATLVNI